MIGLSINIERRHLVNFLPVDATKDLVTIVDWLEEGPGDESPDWHGRIPRRSSQQKQGHCLPSFV